MFKKQKFSYTDYTDELEAYLNEPSANFDMDILAFWKVHENKFTNLSQMARDFLAIPGSGLSWMPFQIACLFLQNNCPDSFLRCIFPVIMKISTSGSHYTLLASIILPLAGDTM
ncbi:10765_t:CDS:2 [Rhizophagus irregularis]|nr:10765_t:CDS:2 [Rhizophagus irregularis]